MKVNVVITPKKNEVVECTNCYIDTGVLSLNNQSGRGRNIKIVPVAGFKKWIRFYVLPEEKKVGKK